MRELAPGLVLGTRYALVRLLGEGGTGAVWLAEDRERGEPVALKFLAPALTDVEAAVLRLVERLESLRALDVPGLLHPRGLERVDEFHVLASDYLPGGDLGQFRGRSFGHYAPALIEVAGTLDALHARGFVHRDLKCANVLLDGSGHVWLADPELVAPVGREVEGFSPWHASPQQWRGEPAHPADDRYAFGAMLYELACGHPPFYPELSRDKVLFEPAPPLAPRAPLPDRLRLLTLRLLAKDPERRPASMAEVQAELARALEEPAEEPPVRIGPAAAASPTGGGVLAPPRRRWPLVAVAVLVAATAATFLLLPHFVADPAPAAGDARAALVEQQRKAAAAASLEALRARAAQSREEFGKRRAALAPHAPERFATRDWQQAGASAELAARRFAGGDFDAAHAAWQEGLGHLRAVDAAARPALEAALARAGASLGAGRIEDARLDVTLAAAIAPSDARVKTLGARVARWGDVLALVDAAARDEAAGRTRAAAEGYRRALALDHDAPGAGAALARLGAAQASDAYEQAMSRGLAALAAGRVDAARTAFNAALALRPGAAEPADALRQIEQGHRSRSLDELRGEALAAERAERWDEAVGLYLQAQRQEATLAFAREGLQRAEPRADLARRLRDAIAEPSRLWSEPGRANARQVLARASAVAGTWPVLDADRRRLAGLLATAETPVRVALRSDNLTDVVVYRVGRLGAFEARELELVPGRYTAVGTRTGYRDVRREFFIEPGKAPEPLMVRCEEQI